MRLKIKLQDFFFEYNPWQAIWLLIWNISEYSHFGLGRFAPWIFSQMIGSRRKKI